MLLIRTVAVITLANVVAVLSSIMHYNKELNVASNQGIPVDQVKDTRQSVLVGGKHDVEQIDSTKFEVSLVSLLLDIFLKKFK
uniref:Secreted RxLR effector peptide protein n=1 Tax=Elaeophora elaphi TaxID=1147741 RepID=A0A0R3RQN1_9BILA